MASGMNRIRGPVAALFALSVWLVACTEQNASQPDSPIVTQRPRIASLSPAISRTLVDLGLADRLVGRSRFCRAVDPAVPVVGDLTHVDYEILIRLRPTHVLLQPPINGLDPELAHLARAQGWTLGVWPSLNDIDDIEKLISDLPGMLFPEPSAAYRVTRRRATELLHSIEAALRADGNTLFQGRTLMLSGLEPIMAFGHDTYMHDILTRLGARNPTEARGWVQLSFEDVIRLGPEAIVLVLDMESSNAPETSQMLRPLAALPTAAARERRLRVLAHPDALLPSSGVVEVADAMRGVLQGLACGDKCGPAGTGS